MAAYFTPDRLESHLRFSAGLYFLSPGKEAFCKHFSFPSQHMVSERLSAEVPYGQNKTKCSVHSNKLAVNPSPEAKSHAENTVPCCSQIHSGGTGSKACKLCGNQSMFSVGFAVNSAVRLVFNSTETLNVFLVYLLMAIRKAFKKKIEEKCNK